jgi:hypothetical protein
MAELAMLPPTPSKSRYFGRSANINSVIPPLNSGKLSLLATLNDENHNSEESEWPSEDETLAGNDSPIKSRYFGQRGNDKVNEKPLVSRLIL